MKSNVVLAYDYPVLGAFWTILLIVAAAVWLVLLFRVITDIFRDRHMSGPAKATWLVGVIVFPFLGVFLYVVARGGTMVVNNETNRGQQDKQSTGLTPSQSPTDGGQSTAAELKTLSNLRAHGDISVDDYERAKERILHH